jgi:hypothetical protein
MHLLLFLELPVLAVLLWLGAQWALLLYNRRINERFLTAQARLQDAAKTTVKELQQVVTEGFKAARVDRRLKSETIHELRSTALKSLQANLGPLGLRELRRALGVPRRLPLDRVLVSYIEAAVYDLKASTARDNEVPTAPGKRFSPETLKIPRVEKPPILFDPKPDEASLHEADF